MDYTGSQLDKKLSEAKDLIKKAQDSTKTSFFAFRFSEDWIAAARYSRDAVAILRQCGSRGFDDLMVALDLMANANAQEGHYGFSGTSQEEKGEHLSKAASTATDQRKKDQLVEKACEAFKDAGKYFQLAKQIERACTCYLKAAQTCRDHNQNFTKAIEYGRLACKLYENKIKLVSVEKPLRQTLVWILEAEQYDDAIEFLSYQNEILSLSRGLYANNIHKNYYAMVIILVYLQQYDRAQKICDKYSLEDADFSTSSEYAATVDLLRMANDVETLLDSDSETLIKQYKQNHPVWKYLERPISLLFNKMKFDPNLAGMNVPGDTATMDWISDDSNQQQLKPMKPVEERTALDDLEDMDIAAQSDFT